MLSQVAIVGITWQLSGQRPNVGQSRHSCILIFFVYFSSASCFSDCWIKWLAWFVVGWYRIHHNWQRGGHNPRRTQEGRLLIWPPFLKNFGQDFSLEFTMGPEYHSDPYYIPVIRPRFPREIGVLYPELRDESITTFDDNLNLNDNGGVFCRPT